MHHSVPPLYNHQLVDEAFKANEMEISAILPYQSNFSHEFDEEEILINCL